MTQKTMTLLSMCAVIVAAVGANEFVLKTSASDQDRQVASFAQRYEPEQIKWEQELADSISKDSQSKTILAAKPSPQDRMLFELLEGHYAAETDLGKIKKITLLPNQAPLEINTNVFLKKYASLMQDFTAYNIRPATGATDTAELTGKSGEVVGNLVISRDDKGRVLSIEIR